MHLISNEPEKISACTYIIKNIKRGRTEKKREEGEERERRENE